MRYDVKPSDDCLTVSLMERVTYSDHSAFKSLIDDVTSSKPGLLVLDIGQVDFIDSAGLGMLLMMRDSLKKSQSCPEIVLRGAQGQVGRVMEASHFDKLFRFER